MKISQDNENVITGLHSTVMKLWKLSTGAEICTFIGHSSDVVDVAIN